MTVAAWGRRIRGRVLDVAVRGALMLSDACLRTFGLERSLRWVGARGSWMPTPARTPSTPISRSRLALVGVIMRRRSGWTRTDGPCLRQALLVALVLRRHRPVVHLGLASADGGPRAHAWVTAGDVRIDYDHAFASFVAA